MLALRYHPVFGGAAVASRRLARAHVVRGSVRRLAATSWWRRTLLAGRRLGGLSASDLLAGARADPEALDPSFDLEQLERRGDEHR